MLEIIVYGILHIEYYFQTIASYWCFLVVGSCFSMRPQLVLITFISHRISSHFKHCCQSLAIINILCTRSFVRNLNLSLNVYSTRVWMYAQPLKCYLLTDFLLFCERTCGPLVKRNDCIPKVIGSGHTLCDLSLIITKKNKRLKNCVFRWSGWNLFWVLKKWIVYVGFKYPIYPLHTFDLLLP